MMKLCEHPKAQVIGVGIAVEKGFQPGGQKLREAGSAAGEPARPLAVEICPLVNFFPAEEYHQKYLEKHPGGYCHIPARFMHLEG